MSSSKKLLIVLTILALVTTIGEIVLVYFAYSRELELRRLEKMEKEENYNKCLIQPVSSDDLTETILSLEEEITNYIGRNYYASVGYYDVLTGFSYNYKNDVVYYGASLIKIVDALYLINEAIDGKIDLDKEMMMYTSKYKCDYSTGMEKKNYGDMVSLRELITYAITYSDNSAHEMLYDYIGRDNLKNYGNSLGAKYIMTGGDHYGNQTVDDTMLYLKEAYNIIINNEE